MAQALTDQSEHAFEMTNEHFAGNKVDTFPMRNAIVKYLMGIHGIRDTYFDYSRVNKIMHKEHKAYTKKIMCDPKNISATDFQDLKMLTPEERCHVCIIVMETKKRVELLYFTKALSQLINF